MATRRRTGESSDLPAGRERIFVITSRSELPIERRDRVRAVRVGVTDLSVAAVDHQLNAVALRLCLAALNCLCLGVVDTTSAGCAFLARRPTILVGHYMNVFLTHSNLLQVLRER